MLSAQTEPCEVTKLFICARERIRKTQFAIEDQRYLLENLCGLIACGRLPTEALAFQRISTIVRSKLSVNECNRMRQKYVVEGLEPPKKRVVIKFPDQHLEISEKEHELYKPHA